ncbi:MAG: hypothetical protein QM605_13490 [Sphingobium sp.]
MTLKSNVSVLVTATLAAAPEVGVAAARIQETFSRSFANGVGAGQANNIFADEFSISGAGTQTYDLAGGIANALGQVLTFTAIKALVLVNTGTAALTYGGGSNPFLGWLGDASDEIVIPAGGMLTLTDPTAEGQAVTPSTGDIITIGGTNAAGTIIIIGEA